VETYLAAAGAALAVALITISYQAIKAASADPVGALKYE
jgi:ABC-type antimicrobial peptide transport system permease subunit